MNPIFGETPKYNFNVFIVEWEQGETEFAISREDSEK